MVKRVKNRSTQRQQPAVQKPAAPEFADLKITMLGLRMLEASTARYRANWWMCREDSEEVCDHHEEAHHAYHDGWEAQKKATKAIVAAARQQPHKHLLDLAVAARCTHNPDSDVNETEDLAKLSLIQALLALGGIDEKICDEDTVVKTMGR